jgi:small subunit ribosomal protein S11
MAETKKQEKTTAEKPVKKPKAKKKRKLVDVHGVAHIHATVNNTIVTITDTKGNAIA